MYISLSNVQQERLMIQITQKLTLIGFFSKIQESLEMKYEFF